MGASLLAVAKYIYYIEKAGQISIVNYSYKKTLNDNLYNVQKSISCTF